MAKYEPTDTFTFTSDSVTLSQAAAAALLAFASRDATRPKLGVGISDGSLCATDGHALLRFDAPQCEPSVALKLDRKVWSAEYVSTRLKVAKADKTDVRLDFEAFKDMQFPPVGTVVPEPGFGVLVKGAPSDKGIRKMKPTGVNPEYLARMVSVTKACGTKGVQLTALHGELDPIMFTICGPTLKATVVIMPMRI